jgi:predicted nucleic acid-binding protein
MRSGLDFVDPLHLAKAAGCEAFVSFDRQFAAVNALSEAKVRPP